METALNCANIAIAWTDAQGTLQGGNAAFNRLLDRPHQPLLNQPLLDLLPLRFQGELLPGAVHPVGQALTASGTGKECYELHQGQTAIAPSSPARWLEIAWSALSSPPASIDNPADPSRDGAVFVIRDITAQTLAEKILQQALLHSEEHQETQITTLIRANQTLQQQLQAELCQRQQLETKLQQQQDLLAASHHGVALLNPAGEYLSLNSTYAQTFGYQQVEDLIGQSWQGHCSVPESQQLKQAMQQQRSWQGEIVAIQPDGRSSAQRVFLSFLTNGNILISCREVDFLKQAETTLHQLNHELEQRVQQRTTELEQLNRQLQLAVAEHQQTEIALRLRHQAITASSNGIVIADASQPDLPLIYVNPAFEQQTGYAAAEVLGKNCRFLQGDDREQPELAHLRAAIQNGQHCTVTLRNYRKDGAPFWNQLTLSPIYDEQHQLTHFVGIQTDISDRKRVEDNLRESEERLRFALEAADMGAWEANLATGIEIWSEQSKKLFGFDPQTFDGKVETFFDRVHPDDRETLRQLQSKLQQTRNYQTEFRILLPDGNVRWIATRGKVFLDEASQPVRLSGVDLDITDRKQAETSLQESEERLRMALESADMGVWDWNLLLGKETWSSETERIFGFAPGTFDGKTETFFSRLHRDDLEMVRQAQQQALQTGHYQVEFRILRPDNSIRWIDNRGKVFRDETGKAIRMSGISTDVTERKLVEAALAESEARYRTLVANIPGVVYRCAPGPKWTVEFISESIAEISGYPVADFLHRQVRTYNSIIHPEDRERVRQEVSAAITAKQPFYLEYRILRADGRIVWLLDRGRSISNAQGESLYLDGVIFDISDRKRIEETLRHRENRYRGIVQSQLEIICRAFPDTTIIFVNEAVRNYIDIEPRTLVGTPWLDMVYPDDRAAVTQQLALLSPDNPIIISETRILDFQGRIWWFQANHQGLFDAQGHLLEIQTVGRDITPAKQLEAAHQKAEAALRQSEEQFRRVFEDAPIGIGLVNFETFQLIKANSTYCDMLGYSHDEIVQMSLIDFSYPEDMEVDTQQVQKMLRGEIPCFCMEKRYIRKNKEILWTNLTVTLLRDQDEHPLYMFGMIEDITTRKRAEAALLQSKARFQRLVANVPGVIYQYIWRSDGSDAFTYISPRCREIFDVEPEAILENSNLVWQMFHPDDLPTVREAIEIAAQNLLPCSAESRIISPSGQIKWLQIASQPARQMNGDLLWDGLLVDITEQKKAEESLQLTRFFLDRVSDAVYLTSSDARFTYVNESACSSLGYSQAELLNMSVQDIDPSSALENWSEYWQNIAQRSSFLVESTNRSRTGSEFPVEISVNYLQFNNQEYKCAIVRDISERKRAEAQLRASLQEKEVLLKEIHHRVKNNLQTICSLLNLQANSIQDPKVLELFNESQRRVKAMALIHEWLYRSGNLAKIDFSKYVQSLIQDLFQSAIVTNSTIRFQIDVVDVELPVDVATPCALIINELVSNAIKYAFPANRGGQVNIQFSINPAGQYILQVQDDGIGIPETIDITQTDSLGLQLVSAFTNQLRGTLELERYCGSTFKITFASFG
jgi:PAS domain S-box-containing protein